MAAGLDTGLGAILAVLLSSTAGLYFAHRAVVMLHIGEPDTFWQGPVPLMLGVFGEVIYLLPFAMCLAWAPSAVTGMTAGKWACGLHVRQTDGTPAPRARLFARTTIQTIGGWGWTLALVAGAWQVGAVATAAAIVVWSVAVHDRLTGTAVWTTGTAGTPGR